MNFILPLILIPILAPRLFGRGATVPGLLFCAIGTMLLISAAGEPHASDIQFIAMGVVLGGFISAWRASIWKKRERVN